ncbi:hypothetical protein [Plantactinospora sp. B5E13]|uniref:hypothetical protein n=1 Tax=unclassified Plantactinospora TaxID=2631981 RepID=UPI00325D5AD6
METVSRRRLRSTSVQLGALTALALTLTACNQVGDDDDDCDRSTRPRSLSSANPVPTVQARLGRPGTEPTAAVPDQGGFGTHLASCGG